MREAIKHKQQALTIPTVTESSQHELELDDFYSSNPKFYVAVDCVILGYFDGKLKVLLQKRDFEPFSGEFSLQGGFVQEGEDLDAAAERVLFERTGIHGVYISQVGTFGKVGRDPVARVISTAFSCLIDGSMCDDGIVKSHYGMWADIDDMPQLHFGHNEMVDAALAHLRLNIGRKPIGFHLLPPMFTLTQMQQLYEAVLGEKLDKRNFRKRIAEMSFIEKTDQIDKLHSKRGAVVYKYNEALFKRNAGDRKARKHALPSEWKDSNKANQ